MLRLAFVSVLILIGAYFTLQAPFYGLLFYIGNAYFRPEQWEWSGFVGALHLSLIIGSYVVIVSFFSKHKFVCNGPDLLHCVVFFAVFSLYGNVGSCRLLLAICIEFLKVVLITYLIVVLTTDFEKFRLVILVMVLALGVEQAKQGWFYLVTSPGGPNQNDLPFPRRQQRHRARDAYVSATDWFFGSNVRQQMEKAVFCWGFHWLPLPGPVYLFTRRLSSAL